MDDWAGQPSASRTTLVRGRLSDLSIRGVGKAGWQGRLYVGEGNMSIYFLIGERLAAEARIVVVGQFEIYAR